MNSSRFNFSSLPQPQQCPRPPRPPHPLLQLRLGQPRNFVPTSAPGTPATFVSMAPRQPCALVPRPSPPTFVGLTQDVMARPLPPKSMHANGPIAFQELRSLQHTTNFKPLHGTNRTSNIKNNIVSGGCSIADKPFLNPGAQTFGPKNFKSVVATELNPKTTFSCGLPQSQSPNTPQKLPDLSQQSREKIASRLKQKENIKPSALSSTKVKLKGQESLSSPLINSSVSSVDSASQTILSGTDWDVKLCPKCKESLFGHGSQEGVNTNMTVAPIFLKLKDISMQHKLKYLAMKAAVFVRESPTVLTQPQELKSKLLTRLNQMCSLFAAQSQTSSSWQDDIACSVAVNLLIEEPDLSSAQNNSRFLQQLKGELESHMEIAQDILNQQQEIQTSDIKSSGAPSLDLNCDTSSNKTEINNNSSSTATFPDQKRMLTNSSELPSVIHSASQTQYNENPAATSNVEESSVSDKSNYQKIPIPVVNNSNQPLGSVSTFGALIPPSLPTIPEFNDSRSSPTFQTGPVCSNSVLNNPAQLFNPDMLHSMAALNPNLTIGALPNDGTLCAGQQFDPMSNISVLNPNPSPPLAPFITNALFNSNPLAVANSSNSLLQQNASQQLLNMQQNCLEMLNGFNALKQQQQQQSVVAASVDLNCIGETVLDSDRFVSQVCQSVANFKLESYSPPEVSPSPSIDDDISVALSNSSQDRVRHFSGSTNNSDSSDQLNKKRKQQHHGKDVTGTYGGVKKMAPLDFRKANKSNFDKQESDFGHTFDSRLGELYVSVRSDDVNENETTFVSRVMPVKSDIAQCKQEMSSCSVLRPLRRLTPLQRKLLKKNGPCSGNPLTNERPSQMKPPTLPKTVELEEHPHSFEFQSMDDEVKLSEPELKTEKESLHKKVINPFVTACGDAATSRHDLGHSDFSDFTSISESDGKFVFKAEATNILHGKRDFTDKFNFRPKSTEMSQRESDDMPKLIDFDFTKAMKQNRSHADSFNGTTLKAIGQELCRDLHPQSETADFVSDHFQRLNVCDEFNDVSTTTKVCEDGEVLPRTSPSFKFYLSHQSDFVRKESFFSNSCSKAVSGINQKAEFLQQSQDLDLDTGDNRDTAFLPSDKPVNEAVSVFARPSCALDTDKSLVHRSENNNTDSVKQPSFQFPSYSDIVKQKKPTQQQKSSSLVVLKPSKNYNDANNNNDDNDSNSSNETRSDIPSSSCLNNSYPSLYDKKPMGKPAVVSELKSKQDGAFVNPTKEMTTGNRTWSSLFSSDSSGKRKLPHTSTLFTNKDHGETINDNVIKKSAYDDCFDIDKIGKDDKEDDKESDGSSTTSSQKKIGKYGLDDFDTTPLSLKTNKASDKDDTDTKSRKESSSVFESEWKVVTKKPKKTGENPAMDTLLKNFRLENDYKELCDAIVEKYPGISKQTSQDVLETVFVETDGTLVTMDEWEVLEEVEVALTQMCPDKLTTDAKKIKIQKPETDK